MVLTTVTMKSYIFWDTTQLGYELWITFLIAGDAVKLHEVHLYITEEGTPYSYRGRRCENLLGKFY
jgi:hypothetical protein